jgi:hypothetical protein
MKKQLVTLLLLFLAFFNAFGCSGNQGIRVGSRPEQDSGVFAPADIPLLGLPTFTPDSAVVSTDASAIVPNGQNGEQIVPLRQGATAPFNGLLLNGPSVARITVEYQGQQQRCLIERRHDVELLTARYDADVATLNLARTTDAQQANLLLSGRDQDITRLQRLLTTQTAENSGPRIGEGLIWASGGLVVGVLLVGGIVLLTRPSP